MSIINDALKKTQNDLKQENNSSAEPTKPKKPRMKIKIKRSTVIGIAACVLAIYFIFNSNIFSSSSTPSASGIKKATPISSFLKKQTSSTSKKSIPKALKDLQLSGIVEIDGIHYAVINDAFFSIGDPIDDKRTIADIATNKVEIFYKNELLTLSIR